MSDHVTPELIESLAASHYTGPDAPCPWEAVHPLGQMVLRHRWRQAMESAVPVLLAAGWQPPRPIIADRHQFNALEQGTQLRDSAGRIVVKPGIHGLAMIDNRCYPDDAVAYPARVLTP